MISGKVISFEGISGSGKTTLVENFTKYLKNKNIRFIIKEDLKEYADEKEVKTITPRNKNIAKDLATILKIYSKGDPYFRFGNSDVETFLILAKRAFDASSRLKPFLDKGYYVVCDGDIDIVCAYQLVSLKRHIANLDVTYTIEILRFLNNLSFVSPSLTFFLDADIDICHERAKNNKNFDKLPPKGVEFKEFLKYANLYYKKCIELPIEGRKVVTVNANSTNTEMLENVIREFEKWKYEIKTSPSIGIANREA